MPVVTKQTQTVSKSKPKTGILSKIQDLDEQESGITMVVYGKSGSGKTRLATTFPKPILLIGAEDGRKSIRGDKDVKFLPLTETTDINQAVDLCKDKSQIQSAYGYKNGFATVVLDTASSLQDLTLKEILGLDELPPQKSWGMASREQYGQCSLKMKEFLRALLQLSTSGTNVVIIAQERDFNAEVESDILKPSIGPALSPSVAGWLNPACDYVCHTYVRAKYEEKTSNIGGKQVTKKQKTKGVEFCLGISPDDIYMRKFRLPRGKILPDLIVDPSYDKVRKLLETE